MTGGNTGMKIYRWLGTLLAWLVLTTAHAAEPSETHEPTKAQRLEAILTEALPEAEYREMSRCLWTTNYRTVEVLNDRYLIFRGSKQRVWINRLRNRCHGLRKNQILIFERSGMRLCSTDTVSSSSFGFGITARCMLGEFEEIDELRADALEEALRKARRS